MVFPVFGGDDASRFVVRLPWRAVTEYRMSNKECRSKKYPEADAPIGVQLQ